MKKALIIIGLLIAIAAITSGIFAFDLVEGMSLYSATREEARIDGSWIVINESQSHLSGFLFYYPLNNTGGGFINLYYEGATITGEERNVFGFVDIDNVYNGTYGFHFNGIIRYLPVRVADNMTYYKNVETAGFYNQNSTQIYVSFSHGDLGMTWVTFMQES